MIAVVALGSNLGDRAAHLDFAVFRLKSILSNLCASAYHETTPVGVADPQLLFLNAAVVGETDLSARYLLTALRAIEHERGRERPYVGAARTLDLDLILFGREIIDEPDLIIPHPRFRDRAFVLEPLVEIAPGLRDPITGRTAAELLAHLRRQASEAHRL